MEENKKEKNEKVLLEISKKDIIRWTFLGEKIFVEWCTYLILYFLHCPFIVSSFAAYLGATEYVYKNIRSIRMRTKEKIDKRILFFLKRSYTILLPMFLMFFLIMECEVHELVAKSFAFVLFSLLTIKDALLPVEIIVEEDLPEN